MVELSEFFQFIRLAPPIEKGRFNLKTKLSG